MQAMDHSVLDIKLIEEVTRELLDLLPLEKERFLDLEAVKGILALKTGVERKKVYLSLIPSRQLQ